jgi:putative methyltransferase (TIGR04325 family)
VGVWKVLDGARRLAEHTTGNPIRRLIRLARDVERYVAFPTSYGAFRGVYQSFEEAIADAPASKPIGYDQPGLAQEYVATLSRTVEPYDYPMIFWLSRILKEDLHVFDFGGNVGTHFYAYASYLKFPYGLSWTVCDVPAIVAAGQELAARTHESAIRFTTTLSEASGCEVFMASGSAQYLEKPTLQMLLSELQKPPTDLLINRLPLYDGESFVTLQNGGPAFYPQWVFNRKQYISDLERLDFELVDTWEDCIDSCWIPFHPGKSLRRYRGLYLRRRNAR